MSCEDTPKSAHPTCRKSGAAPTPHLLLWSANVGEWYRRQRAQGRKPEVKVSVSAEVSVRENKGKNTASAKRYRSLTISGNGGHVTSAGFYEAGESLCFFYKRGQGWFWCVEGVDKGLSYETDDVGPFASYEEAKRNALAAQAETIRGYIESKLSRRDCEQWHAGQLTRNTRRLVEQFGPFQIWGTTDPREGEEPLSVVYPT